MRDWPQASQILSPWNLSARCLRALPARTYFFLQGFPGGGVEGVPAADVTVDLFRGTGFPRSGCGGQDPRGSPERLLVCFHGSVYASPPLPPRPPQAQASLASPRQACGPRSPPPRAPGPLRGPVVCGVEWKIPPRPS